MIAQKKNPEKYDAILAAAINVIGQAGYHNAPISRIAREAGVADGTVYLYFKNKEDVLMSILRETIGHISHQIKEQFESETDPIRKLRCLVSTLFETFGRNKNLALVIQIHLRQADEALRREIGEIIKPYYSLIEHIVYDGMEKGLFRKTIDPRIARRMVFGTIDETITAWVLTGAKYSLTGLTDQVVDLLVHGMKK
ncbi:TetR/AcrR family transcriptional regulator [Effusibacillus lacus]|uniref:TetR/AcrR family transcriptional regulator n=1 Tax=Effusibacillus lacus TaxID=1348429 RepID=UPI000BB7A281|nr:TetR/AcrR family transcriptional regulator [Effusibacillus lacus]TCS75565.1 TetR family transcriptional regulator [Effusibacillus lacus]